jgi:hypothetical protein
VNERDYFVVTHIVSHVFRAIMSKAFIQKPAPEFSAKAVAKNGEFVDIKLSDYKGTRNGSQI